jgi:hypothetical protein
MREKPEETSVLPLNDIYRKQPTGPNIEHQKKYNPRKFSQPIHNGRLTYKIKIQTPRHNATGHNILPSTF